MEDEKNKLETSKSGEEQPKPETEHLLPDEDLKSATNFGEDTTNERDIFSFEKNINTKRDDKKTKDKSKSKK